MAKYISDDHGGIILIEDLSEPAMPTTQIQRKRRRKRPSTDRQWRDAMKNLTGTENPPRREDQSPRKLEPMSYQTHG